MSIRENLWLEHLFLTSCNVHMACNITNLRFGTGGFVQCDGLVNQGFLFRGQIVVVNESQSLNSAGFNALRYLTVGGALDAKRASFGFAGSALLMRLKRNGSQGRAIPVRCLAASVELRSTVRASHGAGAAADALGLINKHFSVRAFINGLSRADRQAGRIVAVLAAHAEIVDDAVLQIFCTMDLIPLDSGSNFIFFFAGNEACLAADAFIDIDDYSELAHRLGGYLPSIPVGT